MDYIVNMVMPARGQCMTVADYMAAALHLGFNRFQSMGSIGGAVTNGSLTRNGKTLIRI